jgi:hypothetical protein
MLLQQAIIIRPIIAINTMIPIPTVRSQRFSTLAMGIRHAALMTLVMTLINVSNECSENSLVMYAERFEVKLDWSALTEYNSHMLNFGDALDQSSELFEGSTNQAYTMIRDLLDQDAVIASATRTPSC